MKIDINPQDLKNAMAGQRKIIEENSAQGGYIVYQDENGNLVKELKNGTVIILQDKDGKVQHKVSKQEAIYNKK